jgi:hypothetical protein
MAGLDEKDEDDLLIEEIERRTEPRGLFPGMVATIKEGAYQGKVLEVAEISRRGMFLKLDAPDAVPLGTRFHLDVVYQGRKFACDLTIARKEIAPRRGIAGRITALDDHSSMVLDEILATATASPDPA